MFNVGDTAKLKRNDMYSSDWQGELVIQSFYDNSNAVIVKNSKGTSGSFYQHELTLVRTTDKVQTDGSEEVYYIVCTSNVYDSIDTEYDSIESAMRDINSEEVFLDDEQEYAITKIVKRLERQKKWV